jgi:hypothetical protein
MRLKQDQPESCSSEKAASHVTCSPLRVSLRATIPNRPLIVQVPGQQHHSKQPKSATCAAVVSASNTTVERWPAVGASADLSASKAPARC